MPDSLDPNPHTNNYMVCEHLWMEPQQPAHRFLDKPCAVGDSGIYYLCLECSKLSELSELPPSIFHFVPESELPPQEFVVEQIIAPPEPT